MKFVVNFFVTSLLLHSATIFADYDPTFVAVYAKPNKLAICTEVLSLQRVESRFRQALKQIKNENLLKKPLKFSFDSPIKSFLEKQKNQNLLKIEIGASNLPICEDCLYVDNELTELRKTRVKLRLTETEAKGRLVHADVRSLPFASQTVDVVVSGTLFWFKWDLESLTLINDAFKEISRVLKSTGAFLIVGPGGYDTHREYSAFVFDDKKLEGRGIFFQEIGSYERSIESFHISPVDYEDAFLLSHGHLARVAGEYDLKVLWFRTPHYDGLILTPKENSLYRANSR